MFREKKKLSIILIFIILFNTLLSLEVFSMEKKDDQYGYTVTIEALDKGKREQGKVIFDYPFKIIVKDRNGNRASNIDVSFNNMSLKPEDRGDYEIFKRGIVGTTNSNGELIFNKTIEMNGGPFWAGQSYFVQAREKNGLKKSQISKGYNFSFDREEYKIFLSTNTDEKIEYKTPSNLFKVQTLKLITGEEYKDIKYKVEELNGISYKGSNERLIWESKNPDIVEVTKDGTMRAIKEGKALITARINSDPFYKESVEIEVYDDLNVSDIRFEKTSIKDGIGRDMKDTLDTKFRLKGKSIPFAQYLKELDNWYIGTRHEIKFNEKGELIGLNRDFDDGKPYSVIVNGKVKKNHEELSIGNGDDVLISYNNASNILNLDIEETNISARNDFTVTVKDENGEPVKDADIYVSEIPKVSFEIYEKGTTKEDGKANINIRKSGNYYIYAEKENGYIKSKHQKIYVSSSKAKVNHDKEVYNNKNFKVIATEGLDGLIPLENGSIYCEPVTHNKDSDSDSIFKIGELNEDGIGYGKIEGPAGDYNLIIKDEFGNLVYKSNIEVLDGYDIKKDKISKLPEKFNNASTARVGDSIYIFGGKYGESQLDGGNSDNIYKYNIKTDSFKKLNTKLRKNCLVEAISDGKLIYLVEKNGSYGGRYNSIYSFDPETEKINEISSYNSKAGLVGKGLVINDNNLYFYTKEEFQGKLNKLDLTNTEKGIEVVGNIKAPYRGYTEGIVVFEKDSKIYLIGGLTGDIEVPGLDNPNIPTAPIYVYDLETQEFEYKGLKEEINLYNSTPVVINNEVYLFTGVRKDRYDTDRFDFRGSSKIVKLDIENWKADIVGHTPYILDGYDVEVYNGKAYIFGGSKYSSNKLIRIYDENYFILSGFPKDKDDDLEETPEKPEETPEKPEETPEKPEETPEKPEETPEKPEETPEKPEETPEKPEETPEKPEETPEKPEETPEKPEVEVNFDDINGKELYWAKDSILKLAKQGIIKGRETTKFEPHGNITRAEFTALMVRIMDVEEIDENIRSFSDVKKGSWYYDEIKKAVSAGIIEGYDDGLFRPEDNITREEISMIISRILNKKNISLENKKVLDKFKDKNKVSNWAKEEVSLLVEVGLLKGYDDGTIQSRNNATRAEMAVMLDRFINKKFK